MLSFRFSALLAILAAASNTNALVVMLMNSTVYPNVADHHCLAAFCGGLGFTSRNYGFHRAGNTRYISERRRVVGCNTTTVQCGSKMICDQIPYPQTYDGGLGCYAQDWLASGRPLAYLYSQSTRRCVPVAEQIAHDTAVNAFYDAMDIDDGQIYSVDVALIGKTGLADPKAVWCNRFVQAYAAGSDFAPICDAAAQDGTGYGLISKAVISTLTSRGLSCPSRNYRRHHHHTDHHQHDDQDPTSAIIRRQLNNGILMPAINFTQTASGVQTISLFGNADVGNVVWTHSATTGSTTKTTKVASNFNLLNTVSGVLCGVLGLLGLCR